MELIRAFQEFPDFYFSSAIILGLIIGSFLNVVIYRLPVMLLRDWRHDCKEFLHEKFPSDLSSRTSDNEKTKFNLVVPRSTCPHCGHQITALENIPVISYLFLRGRCRSCKTHISIRYPIIETISALLTLCVAWKFGVSYTFLFAALLSWALLSLTMIDYDHQYLPDQITLPFLWLGLILNINGMYTDLISAVIGAVAGYLSLWSVYQAFKLVTGKEGMGFGDFKLLALFGAWLGWQMLPAIILISTIVGSLSGITLIILKLHEKGKPIPFGPYLATAGWITLIWGKEINALYLNFVLGSGS